MNILHICLLAPYNDYWGYQDNLLPKYHQKMGHQVTVITSNTMHNGEGKIVETECGRYTLNDGQEIIRLKKESFITPKIGKILNYSNIYDILCEKKPDFIMIHGLSSFITFQVIKYKKRINNKCKIIADNHLDTTINTYAKTFKGKIFTYGYRILNIYWQNYYDKVYGVTPWRTEYAQKIYGIKKSKLDTLLMGADDEKIEFHNKDNISKQIREKYDIAKDHLLFMTGGKLEANKKIIETMKAFSKLEDKNINLLIFGNLTKEVEQEFKQLIDKDRRIIYIGFIKSEEVYNYFLAGDMGVFLGRHSVLWEQAVACGLPCIFRKYVEEGYVNQGGNSILVDENVGIEEIYSCFRRVIDTPLLLEKAKVRAESVREQFLYSHIAQKSLE